MILETDQLYWKVRNEQKWVPKNMIKYMDWIKTKLTLQLSWKDECTRKVAISKLLFVMISKKQPHSIWSQTQPFSLENQIRKTMSQLLKWQGTGLNKNCKLKKNQIKKAWMNISNIWTSNTSLVNLRRWKKCKVDC
mgnify:CR=1 FL=1